MRQMGIVQDPRAPYQERIISCFGASHTAPKRARFATRFGSLKKSVKRLSTAYLHFARVSIFIFITYDQKFIYSSTAGSAMEDEAVCLLQACCWRGLIDMMMVCEWRELTGECHALCPAHNPTHMHHLSCPTCACARLASSSGPTACPLNSLIFITWRFQTRPRDVSYHPTSGPILTGTLGYRSTLSPP